jgi:GNAT superfamily N-acetyltransferase
MVSGAMTDRKIRVLTPLEVETLVDWAAAEGWNPGLADAAPFRAADPEGFLGAFVRGEMVGGASAVAYDEAYAFFGLFIVRPDRRGQGHGKALAAAAFQRLAGRTVGLDGVLQQIDTYRRWGFETAWRTVRFSGCPAVRRPSPDVVPVGAELASAVAAYDRRWFPAPRPAFLVEWLGPPRRAFALLRGGDVAGYGVARQCRQGWKLGPLFADDEDAAAALLSSLAAAAEGEIHIDASEANAGFVDHLAGLGLKPGFETRRMYSGHTQNLPPPGFATSTLELG